MAVKSATVQKMSRKNAGSASRYMFSNAAANTLPISIRMVKIEKGAACAIFDFKCWITTVILCNAKMQKKLYKETLQHSVQRL